MHIRVHMHLCVLVRQSWVFFPEAIFLPPPPLCPSLLWDLPHSLDWLTSGPTWIYLFLSPQLFFFLFKCGSEDWTQVLSALPMECFPEAPLLLSNTLHSVVVLTWDESSLLDAVLKHRPLWRFNGVKMERVTSETSKSVFLHLLCDRSAVSVCSCVTLHRPSMEVTMVTKWVCISKQWKELACLTWK